MTSMDIYIHREDRRYGPYTGGQLLQMLADGSVTREDLSSRGGDERIPVARLLEESPPPPAPELAVTAADLIPEPAPVKLWNPNHAASAAVLSLGVLGPVIHALNWGALGQEERRQSAWGWVVAFLAVYAAIFLLDDRLEAYHCTGILLGLLFCWWFGSGRAQAKFIGKLPQGRAAYRSSKPLLLGSVVFALAALAVVLPLAERAALEETAARIVSERFRESMGSDALECVDLRLGDKLAKDLWQAEGLLDNGVRVSMTVRRMERNVVQVRLNPDSLRQLLPHGW